MPKGLKGFQKLNDAWKHPNAKKTQFKKGQRPWNFDLKTSSYNKASNHTAVHNWLRKHFGKADRCSRKKCKKLSNRFEWCLLKDKEYKKIRKNFIKMCRMCHREYDNWSKKMWITRRKRYGIRGTKKYALHA